MNTLTIMANAEAAKQADLLGALGITWQSLIIQLVSFLILLAILKKFAFPALFAALDKREKVIAESVTAAEDAKKAAEKAEANTEKQLQQAKKDAASIVDLAQKEANRIADEAEARADKKAAHIIEQSHARIESDIADAKKALNSEMVRLVAEATEKVIGAKLDDKTDAELIRQALSSTKGAK